MSVKLCFLCGEPLQRKNQINKNTLTLTYMRHQIGLRYKKFKSEIGDNIVDYHPCLIHLTCYDEVERELDLLCKGEIISL